MDRRTMLGMTAAGLVAGASASAADDASGSGGCDGMLADMPPLRLDRQASGQVMAFVAPGDYLVEREFVVAGVHPAGIRESGRMTVRPGPFVDSVTVEVTTEIPALGLERDVVSERMLDAHGRIISMVRSTYGSHRRHFVVGLGEGTLTRAGDGLSGVLGRHVPLLTELSKTDDGIENRELARIGDGPEWTLIARARWTRVS